MIYLAVDPGKATGVAWFTSELSFRSYIMDVPRYEVEHFVDMAVTKYAPDITVIIESWEVRKNTAELSSQLDPRYIIGAVEYICRKTAVPYHEQTAGQMKSFAHRKRNDSHKVTALGWYKPGEGHDNDAASHLVTFLATDRSPTGDWMRQRLSEVL